MGNNYGQLFIMLAIGAAVLGAAAYFVARWLKGSITINLPGTSFDYGGTIRGSFKLLPRKEIKGNNLTVSLVATETRRERDRSGKSHSHTREVYRSGRALENAKVYPAGLTANYDFELPVPSDRPGAVTIGGDSAIGQAFNAGLNLLAGGRLAWKVEVRLDAEGVDLAASRNIGVGGSSGLF